MGRILSAVKRFVQRPDFSAAQLADRFVTSPASAESALEIFQGQWVSRLPAPHQDFAAGSVPLFDDERMRWLENQLGGVRDLSILELGPLEGGHTHWLEKRGARSIVAVEANTRAYLKCLVIKEIYDLKRARFLCGDFMGFLREHPGRFDLCLASGVLYHQINPVETLHLAAQKADALFLWTHYYDASVVAANPRLCRTFVDDEEVVAAGYQHRLHRFDYGPSREHATFCGGFRQFSSWLSRDDLLGALHHVGFTEQRYAFDHPDHPHGPAICILARKLVQSAG